MSNISTLPSRAEFIRDRLAEYLDGLGYQVVTERLPDGRPALSYEGPEAYAGFYDDLVIGATGAAVSRHDGTTQRLAGFSWDVEPTDTGVMHGPETPSYQDVRLCPTYRGPWIGYRALTR